MFKIITRIIPEIKEEIVIRSCSECKHFKNAKQKDYYTSYYCSLNNQLLKYVYKFPIPDWCPLP